MWNGYMFCLVCFLFTPLRPHTISLKLLQITNGLQLSFTLMLHLFVRLQESSGGRGWRGCQTF